MADKASGAAGGGATGTPLGGITGALQGGVNSLFESGKGLLDKWFPPDKREELKNKIMKFLSEKPQLAGFLLSQLALSGVPLALFFTMSITVLVFALLAGIIVGVLGAVLFTVFCLGLALIILLPTLFMTTFAGAFIFLWGLGAYYIVKWFNQKEIPGIHTSAKEGMKQMGLDNVPALNGEAAPPQAPEKGQKEPLAEKKGTNANAQGRKHTDEKENRPPKSTSPSANKRPQTPNGKGTGTDHGAGGTATKTAG